MKRLLPLLVFLAACSAGRAVRTELGVTQPAREVDALDDLMSARDRAGLARIAAARERAPLGEGYLIGPDDLLDVRIPDLISARDGQPAPAGQTGAAVPTVADTPVYQQGYRVPADGTILIPFLGAVHVAGLTPDQLERRLTERLIAADILRNPHVSVLVAEYRSRVAAMVGSVERPGLYPITRPGMRLADLVWTAGGPSKDAGRVVEFRPAAAAPAMAAPAAMSAPAGAAPSSARGGVVADVRVERAGAGRRLTIVLTQAPDGLRSFTIEAPPRLVIDLQGPWSGSDPAAELPIADDLVLRARTNHHGDGGVRVVLDLARSTEAHGVRAEGTTIVADLGDVAQADGAPAAPAVAAFAPAAPTLEAGGGDGGLVRVDLSVLLQQANEKSLNPIIWPGDVVSVLPAGSVFVDGWVEKPGAYPVTRSLTLTGAVAAAGGHLFPADRGHATVKRTFGPGEQRSFTVDLDAVAEGRAPDMPITDGDVVRLPTSSARIVPWGVWALAREMIHIGGSVLLF